MLNTKLSYILIAGMLCLCALHSSAQYYDEAGKDSLNTQRKNIVGLHLNVPLTFIMTASPNYLQIGLSYKRQIEDYKRLVFQANWIPEVYENNDQLNLVGTNDSLLIYSSRFQKSNDFILGVGQEWGNYSKTISPYYGVDFLFGYGILNETNRYYKARRDTIGSSVIFSEGDTVNYSRAVVDYDNAPYPSKIDTRSYIVGATFTLGCRVQVKSRFEIWTQMTPRILYSHRQLTYENINTGRKGSFDSNSFDFQLRLLQVLLAYKF